MCACARPSSTGRLSGGGGGGGGGGAAASNLNRGLRSRIEVWTLSSAHFSLPSFHAISKSQRKFPNHSQSGNKMVSMVLRLRRALLIPARGCEVAIRARLFCHLGMTTTLTTFDHDATFTDNQWERSQHQTGSSQPHQNPRFMRPFRRKNNSPSPFSTRAY